VFDNEHSLHLWKRHPCTSTVERQLTDWREQVTTWRDLSGLLYSHSDIVRLLIQSNCIELYFNMGCVTFRSLCISTPPALFRVGQFRCKEVFWLRYRRGPYVRTETGTSILNPWGRIIKRYIETWRSNTPVSSATVNCLAPRQTDNWRLSNPQYKYRLTPKNSLHNFHDTSRCTSLNCTVLWCMLLNCLSLGSLMELD
jgi:hypothetical protein